MLDKIILFSIRNKLIIGLFTLALVLYGILQATRLPIDAVPDITDNQVQVITVTPALGAPDVERLITFPIELANSNIPGLKEIRSFSRFGLSLVTVVFHDDVDIYWARQQISERLQQVQGEIPEGIGQPALAPVTTGLGEIYQYVVRAMPGYEQRYSLMELRTIQDWIIRRQLLGTPGVADVSTFGGALKQWEVAVMPEKLKSFGLTIADVFEALANNNQNTGGAYIEKGPTVLYIRSEGLVGSPEDVENIVVGTTDARAPIRIRDLAQVQMGAATRYGAVCYNDQGEVPGAVVMMLKGENSSNVIRRVKEKIAAIQKTLPEGVVIEPFLDRTKMVNNAISTVETNLLEGALIVVLVLVFFLGNVRSGLIVASVIPLSMLFAIILMNFFGVGGNLMSLGAIDFGLIVDGAVIVVEAIMHQITHSRHFRNVNRLSAEQMDEEVHHASSKIMNAAVFGQIIILIVYLPILSLEGIEGKMFKPMAQTVGFAILGAFLLSLTYVPMMSALFINRRLSHKKSLSDRIMERLERWYQHILERTLYLPKMIISGSLILFAGALLILSSLGGEFIPELEEGDFAVDTRVLTGSNLNTTIAATQQTAGMLLRHFPEVEKVVTKIGSGEIPTDPMPIEASDMMVILKEKKAWTSASSFDELAEKMSEKIAEIPGVTAGFQFPVQMRFNELMTGARQDVVCKIFGEDLDTLAHYAQKLGEISRQVEGATEFYVETVNGMPQIVIRYRRDAMAQYGLDIASVNQTVSAAFAGAAVGQVFEGEKRFDLVVRVAGEARQSLRDIQQLPVPTYSGLQIPLSQVADVSEIEGPNQIQREDAKRRIIVGFNVRGRDVQSIVQELQKRVESGIQLPPGYYITYGGAFENLQAARERLSIAVPVAMLLIFLMLYFAFGSVRQGLLIFSAIPLSAIGGIVALWWRDMPFSISAGVGFIALFGVAVLNGIVLISEFNRLKAEGWDDLRRIAVMGTKIRLRSVLMTALAPSLGFIPMAVSMGAGAEVQRPLATVVIGGIISATLLTLFVLPLLYVYFSEKTGGKQKKGGIKSVVILIALSTSGGLAQAQIPISLDAAIQTAWENNPQVRIAEFNAQYHEVLQKSWRDLPKTAFDVELGQFNSRQFDHKLSVGQSFSSPKTYQYQRKYLTENYLAAEAATQQARRQIRQVVGELYFECLFHTMQRQQLEYQDSLLGQMEEKAELRYRSGVDNTLERGNIRLQRHSVRLALIQAENAQAISLKQFNHLLQSNVEQAPAPVKLPIPRLLATGDSSAVLSLPMLGLLRHELAAAQWQKSLAQAQLLPDFNIGVSNQSIIGVQNVQGEDRYFDGLHRFTYLSAGVSAPLFSGAQRARVNAGELEIRKKQLELNWAEISLQQELDQARRAVAQYWKSLVFFESELSAQLDEFQRIADLRFNAGEIDYLEWSVLIRQGFEIRQQYPELLYHYNLAVWRLQQFEQQ